MADRTIENIKIENARLVFRNLSGRPDDYNKAGGVRQAGVVISDPTFAEELKKEGWNIKQFKKRDDDEEEPEHYLMFKASFKNRPPHVYLCTRGSKKLLNEDTIGTLDFAEIANVDIVISPYQYDVRGITGIAGYVKTMYVTVVEDEFASKYENDEEEEVPFN